MTAALWGASVLAALVGGVLIGARHHERITPMIAGLRKKKD